MVSLLLKKLTTLDLENNQIEDLGVHYIAQCLEQNTVRQIIYM